MTDLWRRYQVVRLDGSGVSHGHVLADERGEVFPYVRDLVSERVTVEQRAAVEPVLKALLGLVKP